jgi:hypothetical protein
MTTRPSEPGIDRFDVIAALGVVAMIVGALAVHPALLVIAVGWFAYRYVARRIA